MPRGDSVSTSANNQPAQPAVGERRFYRLDSTRITFAEHLAVGSLPMALLASLLGLLKVRVPWSADDPPVHALDPFACSWADVPEAFRVAANPRLTELAALGFHLTLCHHIEDDLHSTATVLVTLLHDSGRAVARVHLREWHSRHPPRRKAFVEIISALSDGTFLWSLAASPDLRAPAACRVNRLRGATPAELWQAHTAALDRLAGRPTVIGVTTDKVAAMLERHHALVRDFHLWRGVFTLPGAPKEERVAAVEPPPQAPSRHPEVLAEIERLQKQQASGWNALLLLLLSVAVFVGAGGVKASPWLSLPVLIPVLLVHELGHYLAMAGFGYRNLRMFFIPFLGAAVSGQNYNVPGWKKAIVSLAGPVPGIVLGLVLAIVGFVLGNTTVLKVAQVAAVLNGLNLLPVLPLDGGWLLHAVLFSRHHLLDVAFRVLAGLALLGGSIASGDKVLLFLGIFIFVGVPFAYRQARIVTELRAAKVPTASADAQTIPTATADAILDRVKVAFPQRQTPRMLAQLTLNVFQTLNARPPGGLATLAFLAVQVAFLVLALVVLGLAAVGQNRATPEAPATAAVAAAAVVAGHGEPAADPWNSGARRGRLELPHARPHRTSALPCSTDLLRRSRAADSARVGRSSRLSPGLALRGGRRLPRRGTVGV
jgi:Zn-dependent protease